MAVTQVILGQMSSKVASMSLSWSVPHKWYAVCKQHPVQERKTADLCCQEVSEALKSLSSSLAASVRAFSTTSLSLSCAPFALIWPNRSLRIFSKFSCLAALCLTVLLAALFSMLSHFADSFRTKVTVGRFNVGFPSFVAIRAVSLSCDKSLFLLCNSQICLRSAAFSGRFPWGQPPHTQLQRDAVIWTMRSVNKSRCAAQLPPATAVVLLWCNDNRRESNQVWLSLHRGVVAITKSGLPVQKNRPRKICRYFAIVDTKGVVLKNTYCTMHEASPCVCSCNLCNFTCAAAWLGQLVVACMSVRHEVLPHMTCWCNTKLHLQLGVILLLLLCCHPVALLLVS